jgi:hypothetical protein
MQASVVKRDNNAAPSQIWKIITYVSEWWYMPASYGIGYGSVFFAFPDNLILPFSEIRYAREAGVSSTETLRCPIRKSPENDYNYATSTAAYDLQGLDLRF